MNQITDTFSECQYGELLLDYVYGEATPDESSIFAQHLGDCPACHFKLETLNLSREKISQWRQASFDHLSTPSVVWAPPPIMNTVPSVNDSSVLHRLKNWFGDLYFKPILGAGLAAVLLIFAGWLFLASNQQPNSELADNNPPNNLSHQAGVELAQKEAPLSLTAENNPDAAPSDSGRMIEETPEKATTAVNAAGKNSKSSGSVTTYKSANPQAPARKAVATKSKSAAGRNAPRLLDENDFDEQESLRLSDVFAELN